MSTADNYISAADTTNVQAGGKSFFEELPDAIIKGGSAAVVSGLASIYNTGVDVSNYFGANAERIDVHKALSDVDANWGAYYEQHQGAIDTAGFLATSFLPGGLAVKGLNMVRRGEAAGAFGRALNYTTTQQAANLEKALQTIASPEGSLFTKMNKNYVAAIGWGTADQVLQTAAFEIGVAATIKASPMLDGQSYSNLTHDIIKNALVGGAFGGTIEALFMSGIANNARKLIDRTQRKYDILGTTEGLGLGDADKAYNYIDSAMKLPKEVFADDKVLNFTYQLNGSKKTVGLNTGDLYDKALQKTVTNAYQDFEGNITNALSGGDASTGKALARALLDMLAEGKKAGLSDDIIRGKMGDHLFNLEGVAPIGDRIPSVGENIHYFNKDASPKSNPFTKEPIEGASAFRVVGDTGDLKVAVLGKDAMSVKEAWENGFDLAIKTDQKWAVNPKSSTMRPAVPPKGLEVIFNTKNGKVVDQEVATVTAADIATADAPLKVSGDTVLSGGRTFNFKLGDDPSALIGVDGPAATARHVWADSLKKIDGEVNGNDFSVLDKMSAEKNIVSEGATINVNGDVRNWRDFGNFDDFVFNQKLEALRAKVGSGEQDIQQLAYELNASPKWIQDTIASKFQGNLKKMADNAPDLSSGWQRPLSEYSQRENIVLSYKKAGYTNVMDDYGNALLPHINEKGEAVLTHDGQMSFITGQQAYGYRVKLAQDNLDMAVGAVLGDKAQRFIPFTAEELSGLADRNSTGAGLVSFSNANYGDKLRLWSQDSGKNVNILTKEIANANLSRIQPFLAQFTGDAKASAELTAIVTRIRRSAEPFTLLGAEYGLDGAYLVNKKLLRGSNEETLAAIRDSAVTNSKDAFRIESDLTASFLKEHMAINADIVGKRGVLAVARGQTSLRSSDTLYVPPIDTTKVPFFAFVRSTEGKLFSDSNVSMITARNAEELQKLASQISEKDGLQVIFKADNEAFRKAKGDYDYSRALNDSSIDSSLKSGGKLGDYLPSFSVESTLEDFLNFHQRQASQLVKDSVSTKYAQTIAELERLGANATLAQTSKFGIVDKLLNRSLQNPYDDLIKGALDISKRSEFTLLHQTNEMLDALGTRAYRAMEGSFQKAAAGTVSWEEANSTLTKYGLGAPFKDDVAFQLSNIPADRNLLKTAFQKANMVLSNAMLRFDFANSLVNIISTPILLGTEMSSIRRSVAGDPELTGKLAELTFLSVPGTGAAIPSTTKLIANAIKNYWGPEKDALIARYSANGDINSVTAMFHEMAGELSITPNLVPSKYAEAADKWVERTAKITGNTFAEQFTRFVSADVMRQISEPLVQAGKMSTQEQNAYISVFTNRVQGNYIASQRPILFQGTLGSALGLFQTYQFNMMQQLFRHIENRDLKTAAVMGGLQTSVYGLNGLPAFNAINTHLLGNAAITDGHKDAYSYTAQLGPMGDWLMYGTASAFPLFGSQGPSLYSRGDVNPRHPTVIPIAPQDIPAVDATIRFVTNLVNTGQKIAGGGDIGVSLLEGLEHNSINRPLAGLAQALNGQSTTSKGSLIAGNQDLFSIANASRILGAKPLDEAIGLDQKFRSLAYQAQDKKNIEELGSVVKTKLKNNQLLSDDDMLGFMGKYAAAGGRVESFGKAMQSWSRDANQSVLNQLSDKVRSPYGQRMSEVMGGRRIDDFSTQPGVTGNE